MTDKSTDDTTGNPIRRRNFLMGAGTALAASLAADAPASADSQTAAPGAAAPQAEPLLVLNETEHAFVVAAVDTLIPADELSPSGSDCGCAVYIDRQLASAWGGGAKTYRSGPFVKGKPEQGYQLSLTPAEFFSAGIAAANDWSRKTYGSDFDRLAGVARQAYRIRHPAPCWMAATSERLNSESGMRRDERRRLSGIDFI